jgi:hypothetical protein
MKWKKELSLLCLTSLAEISRKLIRQDLTIGEILMKQEELVAKLQAVDAQTKKAMAEIVARITQLQDAIQATPTDLPPEVEAALQNLITTVQALDDLNPDPAPVVETVEPAPVIEQPVEQPVEPQPEPAPVEEAPVEVPVEQPVQDAPAQ